MRAGSVVSLAIRAGLVVKACRFGRNRGTGRSSVFELSTALLVDCGDWLVGQDLVCMERVDDREAGLDEPGPSRHGVAAIGYVLAVGDLSGTGDPRGE